MSDDRKHPRKVETAAEEVSGQPSQRRRRLVKGALSAPVFLTLQNGSVFANTSNDAIIEQTADARSKQYCVVPGDDAVISAAAELGSEKADFGTEPICYNDYLLVQKDSAGNDLSPVLCENEAKTHRGYIVAGSSGGSLTGVGCV